MKISFIVNYIHINDGWSPWDKRVGGSEEAVIEWSKRLVAMGHDVSVFHNGKHGIHCGVEYRDHSEYEPGDVTVNVNYPEFKPQGKTVYYSSLTDNPDLSDFDAVAVLTEFAKQTTNTHHDNLYTVPLGYDETQIYPEKKVPKRCLYASSPDRGLETLELVWPSVVERHPDAELYVTYGGYIPTPNTICGDFTNEEMNELYRTSDIWVHPANGGELYCITGIKAQAAGAIPVYFPTMALQETVRAGVACEDEFSLYSNLTSLLGDEDRKQALREQLASNEYPTWQRSTEQLLKIMQSVIE